MAFPRLAAAVVAAAAVCLASTATTAALATAATGTATHSTTLVSGVRPAAGVSYSYWGFYEWQATKNAWQFSPVGANDKKTASAETGEVYGFRWALVVKAPRPPRAPGDFAAICGSQSAPAGKKKIALVLDFGTTSDSPTGQRPPAPRGLCAVVPTSATAQQALDSVASLRSNASALICGIDGYPSSGCGEKVADATPPPPDKQVHLQLSASDAADDGGSPAWPWIVVAVVVVLALAAGGWVLRTRRA